MVSQFLNLVYWYNQLYIGKTVVEFSHVGTKVVGCTFGVAGREAGEFSRERDLGVRTYNDVRYLKVLWWDIGKNTYTSWKVEVEEVGFDHWGFDQDDVAWLKDPSPKGLERTLKRLQFVVVRVR